MLRDRRESQRKPVLLRTKLEFNGEVREAMATDLSAHGAFCQLDNAPPIGTPVVLSVRGEGGSQIRVRSAVARHETSNMRGIGLSWEEEASSLLKRCFSKAAANSDGAKAAPQPSVRKSPFGEMPVGAGWDVSLEASGDSTLQQDPFAAIDAAKGTKMAVNHTESLITDWSQIPVPGQAQAPSNKEQNEAVHGFEAGTSVRYRVEGKWMVGRIRAVDGNVLQVTSHWAIPLEGHVVQLAGASVVAAKLRVNEATGLVDRVESVGQAGRQGGVFHLRVIHS